MREIKFRFFNPSDKMQGKSAMTYERYSSFEGQGLNEQIKELKEIGLIHMQYTGLKDKNGKEIYEGDIIKDNFNHWNKKKVKMDIYFWHEFVEYGLQHAELEIIGNIYENPELIEDTFQDTAKERNKIKI